MAAIASDLGFLHKHYLLRQAAVGSQRRLEVRHIALAAVLFAVLVVQLWVRVSFIQKGYQLEDLRAAVLHNDARLRQQRLEYAFLTRPVALAKAAREQLGMIDLAPQRLRKISLGNTEVR